MSSFIFFQKVKNEKFLKVNYRKFDINTIVFQNQFLTEEIRESLPLCYLSFFSKMKNFLKIVLNALIHLKKVSFFIFFIFHF